MARIEKYKSASEVKALIKHDMRIFKDGYCKTNDQIYPEKQHLNYSILRRSENVDEIEKYRKQIEQECFKYNRKDIVHCVGVVFTLPTDCPKEEEKSFFQESYNYLISTLPMGEKCVLSAEVHADEGIVKKDGLIIADGQPHLHVYYVPAVPDTKHEEYNFRLCADQLTKRAVLRNFHPNYQKWIDDAGLHATVMNGATSGKGISVKALKEISVATGLSLDEIQTLQRDNELLQERLKRKEKEIEELNQKLYNLEKENIKTQEWGNTSWGSDKEWGTERDISKEYERDKIW